MIKKSQFYPYVNEVRRILHDSSLYKDQNRNPSYSFFDRAEIRDKTYLDIWKYNYKYLFYDYLLEDNSILQFYFSNEQLYSYSYLECPFRLLYEEESENKREDIDLSGKNIREYNDPDFPEHSQKPECYPIRYDYNPNSYNEVCHPASHFHIGSSNNIRISTKIIVTPISFTLFIIRQCYSENWRSLLTSKNFKNWCEHLRTIKFVIPNTLLGNYPNELVLQ